jgi:MFS family permease
MTAVIPDPSQMADTRRMQSQGWTGLRASWPLLVASFLILFVVIGGGVDTVGVFLHALAKENGWPHSTLSAGIGVGVVCAGLATPLAGVLVDRFGVRVPIALGAGVLATGFGILLAMRAPWHFVAANVVLGPGFALAAMLPITIAVTVRIPGRTALALGLVGVGSSLGALVLAPAIQALVDAFGWRTTYLVLGTAVVATPLLLLPLLPRGRLRRDGAEDLEPSARIPLGQELRRPGVLPLVGILFLPGIVNFGLQVHIVPYLANAGYTATLAAAALGAAIGMSAVGKVVGGLLGDRIGALPTLRLALSFDLLAIALLPFVGSTLLLGAFVALHGLAIGAEVAVVPVIALAILGTQRFATLYGILQLGSTIAIGIAPVVPGLFFDRNGSYAGAVVFWIVVMLAGVAISLAMRVPTEADAAGPAPLAAGGEAPSPSSTG